MQPHFSSWWIWMIYSIYLLYVLYVVYIYRTHHHTDDVEIATHILWYSKWYKSYSLLFIEFFHLTLLRLHSGQVWESIYIYTQKSNAISCGISMII